MTLKHFVILENTVRFKFEFTHCKDYSKTTAHLKSLTQYFKELKKLGVAKLKDGAEDDYHRFVIKISDKNKIKKLKKLGFTKQAYEYN